MKAEERKLIKKKDLVKLDQVSQYLGWEKELNQGVEVKPFPCFAL